MYRDIPKDLRGLLEPLVTSHGLELVDLELKGGGGPRVMRVTVDNPSGDGRVPVETCAGLSREISTHLDAEDAVAGSYRLEVSSPGLDRTLSREKDFAAACGNEVKIETRTPVDGRKKFRGRLLEFEGNVARVLVDGHEVCIPFGEVSRANRVYEFTRADFGRGRERS